MYKHTKISDYWLLVKVCDMNKIVLSVNGNVQSKVYFNKTINGSGDFVSNMDCAVTAKI